MLIERQAWGTRGVNGLNVACLTVGVLFAFGPDGGDDEGVADGDDEGWQEEEGGGDEAHVELPLPLALELDPALGPPLDLLLRVEHPDRETQQDARRPRQRHQESRSPPLQQQVS